MQDILTQANDFKVSTPEFFKTLIHVHILIKCFTAAVKLSRCQLLTAG